MSKESGVIYCIENNINGKKYVGQTINLRQRWSKHKRRLKKGRHDNSHLQNSFDKHGEKNFKFRVLEEVVKEKLNEREVYWIDVLDSFNSGYNLTTGGDSNFEFDEQSLKKISETHKGKNVSDKTKRKLSEFNKGKTLSEEVRKKISETLKGRSFSKETRRKLSEANKGEKNHQAKPKEEYIKMYNLYYDSSSTQKEVAEKFNVSPGTVNGVVNHNHWATKNLESKKQLKLNLV